LEFNIDELFEKTDLTNPESKSEFISKVKEHLSFCEKEMKSAFQKRDQIKSAFKNLESKISELSSKEDPAREKLLEKEILEHATKNRAYRPSEVYKLLKDDFLWNDEKSCFTTKDGMTIEEHVKTFLSDNDHHVLSDRKGGTGHSYSPYRQTNLKPKVSAQDLEDADRKGLEISDYITIKQLREKKLKKIGVKQ
jgi:hypothetical protein